MYLTPQKFDFIFFIGSFCHIKNKGEAIKEMAQLLAPEGQIIIEDTFFLSDAIFTGHASRPETQFVQNTIFGFAEILSLPNFLNLCCDQGLFITDLLDHSSSYKKTIDLWLEKIRSLDKDVYPQRDNYIQYMEIAQRGWNKTIANYLITLRKGKCSSW